MTTKKPIKKTKVGQKKHDEALLRSVKWYEGQNFKVKADLPDYTKPKKIKGFIPDMIATKGTKEVILEVETKKSNKTDKEQLDAFKDYADKQTSRDFKKKII